MRVFSRTTQLIPKRIRLGISVFDSTGTEFNDLLNPRHSNFSKIHLGQPNPFDFEARLLMLAEVGGGSAVESTKT